jgi:GWxTD domain-containing protein
VFTTLPIDFYVDPVIYRSSVEIRDTIAQTSRIEDIYHIEFNCAVPYQELHYEEVDSVIVARALLPFKLSNKDRPDSLIDTLYRQFTIPSFSEAARQQISFIVQFSKYVPEGSFSYTLEFLSANKRGLKEGELEITRDHYSMSDILIASDILVDTVSTYLRKGNLRITPHPSHTFSERYENLYIYFEIYDITPDSGYLDIAYTIKDDAGTVVRQMPRRIEKKYVSQAINCGFNITNLAPGSYHLTVMVHDETAQSTAQKETSFKIIKAEVKEITYEGMPYYDEIEYFISSSDYDFFKSLPEEGKKKYLKKFWQKLDYREIAERFEYADEHFQQGSASGSKTDRGRVYVKFGKPDDIERGAPIDYREGRPYEHWQYYNGLQFIFVDVRGTNEYTLVWTNATTEQSQPTLYKYLPPAKEQLVQ